MVDAIRVAFSAVRIYAVDPVLLFWFALQDYTDGWTHVRIKAQTELVFIPSGVIVLDARDGARPRYYIFTDQFNNLSEGLLFWPYDMNVDVRKYFGLYAFALHMDTHSEFMALEIHLCIDINCKRRPCGTKLFRTVFRAVGW